MSRATDISPLSRDPSVVLRNAPAYFQLSGAIVAGISLASLGASLLGSRPFLLAIAPYAFHPLAALATAVGMVWTGRELRSRKRSAGYGAVLTAGAVVFDQLTRVSPSALAIAFGVSGLVLLGAIWDELE